MKARRRIICLLVGPSILVLSILLLPDFLTLRGAQAAGVSLWMIFWWITRPVNITVTGILPVVANAYLNMVPMGTLTAQYASDSIILIFASGLITLPWAAIGLDRRIALKVLSVVGPSMKSQITVWFLSSVALSTTLPNVAVCAVFCPIAVSMLAAAGYHDIPSCEPAVPILIAIGWGVTLGGTGSPLGGAMNLVAISYLEDYTGHEFMYIDWLVRLVPFLILVTAVLLGCMLLFPLKVKTLEGTKAYFERSYAELGPMKRDEKLCIALFVAALIGAFARPLYAAALPGLVPAYIFLTVGFVSFFITAADHSSLLTWETAQKGTMWGMMILFAGGMALGQLINGSGASARIAEMVSGLSLDGGLLTIIVIVFFTRMISEFTNGTTAAAVSIPIVFELTSALGLNPIPYWFITVMAYNGEFMLPISVRAIPVGHGLDTNKMLKGGIPMTIISSIVAVVFGYAAIKLWPGFGRLSSLGV